MAVSCGTPTPATMRVVQIEPGPMPTLMASAPAVDQRLGAFGGGDVAGDHLHGVRQLLDAVDRVEHAARMAVRGVDHDQIDAGVDQRLGAGKALVADRGGGGDAQPALLVLAGVGIGDRLLDVLDRDQADAAVLVVDHQQLLDAVLVQQPLGLVLADALAHGDQLLLGHQLGDRLPRIGGEAHVAVGEDADQLAGPPLPPPSTTGMPEMRFSLHQVERVGQRRVGLDGDRVDHHAGLELLDLPHLRGLLLRLEIAVDDADAAGLRHGDRHRGLGDGVHGRGDDRDVEGDRAGEPRADIDVGRQHFGQAGLEQHVVEGERFARASVVFTAIANSVSPARRRRPAAEG